MRGRARRVNAAPWEHVVLSEVHRFGPIVGHDADDLAQEARLAVMRALSKLDAARGEGAAATYIRRAIQRALINLRRDSRTHGRAPRTSEGRLAGVYSIDAPSSPEDVRSLVETMPADSDTPEETASMRELVRALEERLSRYEAAQLRAVFVEGAKLARARLRGADVDARIERVRLRARAILEGLLVKSDGVEEKAEDGTMTTKKKLNVFQAKNVPDVSAEDATDCHAANEGPDAAGYEPSSEDCTVKCPDKFSCLVALVGNRAKNHLKLTLASDSEVEAVTSGEMTWEGFVKRYNERMALLDAGKPVPAALLPKGAASAPAPAVASDDTGDDDTGDDDTDFPTVCELLMQQLYDCDIVIRDADGNDLSYEDAVAYCEDNPDLELCWGLCLLEFTCDDIEQCIEDSC